jgi:hypothetical protein
MKEPWHSARPSLLAELRADVKAFCSTLHVFVEYNIVCVRGTFPVRHETEDLDSYRIEIELPSDHPHRLPIVRETGGRIPWAADRHVNTNGTACVLLPEDRWWSFPPGRPFLDYLTVPLHNYFLGQSVVEAGGTWPFSEHRHGVNGIIDFYKERFHAGDAKVAVLLLKLVATGRFKGHWQCPCASGKKLRHCHWRGLLNVANRMPRSAAQKSLDDIFAVVSRAGA